MRGEEKRAEKENLEKSQLVNGKWKKPQKKWQEETMQLSRSSIAEETRTEDKAMQGDRNRNRMIITLPTVQEILSRAKDT